MNMYMLNKKCLEGATADAVGSPAVLDLTVIIIYGGSGWKHNPVTRVDVCDVLGTHESKCPWQGRKLAPALPTLSSLSDDKNVLIRPSHTLHGFSWGPELHL